MTTPEDINNVLGSLLAGIEEGSIAKYESMARSPALRAASEAVGRGDIDGFYFALTYPLSNLVDGLLARELPQSREAQFLFKHSQFVERHFRKLIEQYEGSACCADKSGVVLRKLLGFLKTGEAISFDYKQKYTFHLPALVFKTHAEIIEYFEAVQGLYYGNAEQFMQAVNRISSRMSGFQKPSAAESS